jgi:hypothetical protein
MLSKYKAKKIFTKCAKRLEPSYFQISRQNTFQDLRSDGKNFFATKLVTEIKPSESWTKIPNNPNS